MLAKNNNEKVARITVSYEISQQCGTQISGTHSFGSQELNTTE
jgi:hypothetical protein